MKVLDLFAGIGGMSLGLERAGMQTVAFCEIEEFPRRVLAHHWPGIPVHKDVRKLRGEDVGPVDVICGGYPCQPFSTAGQRRGAEDDRHLWPEFSRLVAELRPAWVIGENVAGHISMGLDDVLSDLEGQGYAVRTFVIPACAVNLQHRRDRCWIVAHCDGQWIAPMRGECEDFARKGSSRRNQRAGSAGDAQRQIPNGGAGQNSCDVAHAERNNAQGKQPGSIDAQERAQQGKRQTGPCGDGIGRRCAESRLGRVVDGLPYRVDEPTERVKANVPHRAQRLKALGNAVVPQIPEMIGRAIMEASQ